MIFLCALVLFFFLSTSFAFALSGAEKWIFGIGLGIGGFFTGLGGLLFDQAVIRLVLQMGDLFVNKGLGSVITSIWTMVRDLFNILFIFSLVYIGLRIIYDSDDSRTKKMLGMLIAAALLVNFSLYIAKVVVDVSNFTAVQIYSTATGGISGTFQITDYFGLNQGSISGAYMEVLRVPTWFNADAGSLGNVFVYSVMMMLFLMFLGFVLAYGALMITVRFIAIIFYLMFSPFMFLGWILPQFQSYATKWWKGFLGYSFFAPVYIFMLYIGLYSLQQIKTGFGENASFGNAFEKGTDPVDTFSIFLLFAIGTGFLIGATKVASVMSNGGAAIGMGAADKVSKRFTTTLGARSAGYTASVAAGYAARRIGNGMDERSAASGKPRSRIGRSIRSGVLKGETAKFGGSQSSKERGDGDKEEKTRHTRAHSVQTLKDRLAPTSSTADRQQAFADMSEPQLIEIAKTESGRKLITDNAEMLSSSQMQAISKSDEINDKLTGEIGTAHQTKMKVHVAASGGVGKASTDQLNTLGVTELSEPSNAVHLTDDKIDKLKLVDEHKRTLKQARNDALENVVHTGKPMGGKSITDLSKMSPSKIAELPDKVFYAPTATALPHVKTFLRGLSFNALEEVGRKKSGEVSKQIRGILNGEASATAAPNSYERELHDWLNTDRIGKKFGR